MVLNEFLAFCTIQHYFDQAVIAKFNHDHVSSVFQKM
jgi:hypothetical protein